MLAATLLPAAAGLAGGAADEPTISPPGRWAAWAKWAEPVFAGQYLASDPSLVADGAGYRMSYTCFDLDPDAPFDPEAVRAAICAATSDDGVSWREVPVD